MQEKYRVVDLRGEAPSRVQNAAFYAVKSMARGEALTLLTARDPALMMTSIDLQLRYTLSWTASEDGGGWRIEVRHRSGHGPRDALAALEHDHKRLDGLFVRALQALGHGGLDAAGPLLHEFAGALRRHMHAEDRILTPALGPADAEALAIMLREHGEILAQLALIEECFAGAVADAAEADAYCAILAGTLAKHEHREESNLFPLWRALLAQRSDAERRALTARVEAALTDGGGAGSEG